MKHYEVAIVGQGPAGLSAAIYTSRAGMNTIILGCTPKVAGNYSIDNYFGFPEPITGDVLINLGKKQAEKFGTTLRCEKVLGIHFTKENRFGLKTDSNEYTAAAVILATGVSRIRPGIKNLSEYEGRGVSYCVSCDGFFCRDKKVMVVGEGVFAANQALELKEYTPHVQICTQLKKPDISPEFKSKLQKADIPILEKKIKNLEGDQGLESVRFHDGTSQEVDGLFVAMGEASSLDFAYSLGISRNGIFIEADQQQRTNIPGVFAAGDCVGRFLQISVAAGEGAIAGKEALEYIKGLDSD
ncbi:MAG: NAD(P)/FAD-dependent oxidoreductase [Desulfonatronovibrionaceae bacterium]